MIGSTQGNNIVLKKGDFTSVVPATAGQAYYRVRPIVYGQDLRVWTKNISSGDEDYDTEIYLDINQPLTDTLLVIRMLGTLYTTDLVIWASAPSPSCTSPVSELKIDVMNGGASDFQVKLCQGYVAAPVQ